MTRTTTRHVVWVRHAEGWLLASRTRSARRASSLTDHWVRRGHDVDLETLRDHPRRGPVESRSTYRPGHRRATHA